MYDGADGSPAELQLADIDGNTTCNDDKKGKGGSVRGSQIQKQGDGHRWYIVVYGKTVRKRRPEPALVN